MAYALITGASSGIGLEIARILAGRGYDIVIVGRSRERLKIAKDELSAKEAADVVAISADLADESSAQKIHSQLTKRGVEVEVLVNNAGAGLFGAFWDSDLESINRMIELNVSALTQLTRLFIKDMLKNRRGFVLNVSSSAAFQPGPFMAVYYATKSYVLSFSLALAEELRGTGVSVTALCPGATSTSFKDNAGIPGTRLFSKPMPAERVAHEGVEAMFKGRKLCIPGLKNRFLAFLTRITPISWQLRYVRRLHERVEAD